MADVHPLHDFIHPTLPFVSRNLQISQREFNVLKHVQFVNQVKALEHETDVSLAHIRTVFFFQTAYFLSIQKITSGSRIIQQPHNI